MEEIHLELAQLHTEALASEETMDEQIDKKCQVLGGKCNTWLERITARIREDKRQKSQDGLLLVMLVS